MYTRITIGLIFLIFLSCKRNENKFDASGTFETDEVIVSAEASGQIFSLNIAEGQIIPKDSIIGEIDPQNLTLQKKAEQMQDQLSKTNIKNPVGGTVITKYAETGEITSNRKPLYKIADLSTMNLRAYVTGEQLPRVKLGQPVTVLIDSGANNYRRLPGTITWISDKAEFTPKTVQTKDERANLVYAMKVKVKNDGYLKIGMYGEVKFEPLNAKGKQENKNIF